jgi:RNA polymerase primary sigma factor
MMTRKTAKTVRRPRAAKGSGLRRKRAASPRRVGAAARRSCAVRRAQAPARAARVMEYSLDFMPSREFSRPGASERILAPLPPSPVAPRKARRPADLPPYLASLYEVPLLTAEQERHLFRQYNFLKYRASKLRDELDPARPGLRLLDEIDELHGRAVETKNQLIRANLRLVVAIAKNHVFRQEDFFERVSEGNISLMKAVEKFDYTRGFKFSTYATWAIRKNFAREFVTEARYADRFRTSQDERLDWTADQRSDGFGLERAQAQREDQVGKILDCLNERERAIISRRFGLGQSPEGKTLKEVGVEFGISKERIRQIETRALAKLRDAAAIEKIEAL